jgi:NAD(P)-dependent dehydrogenase (short-subunit alcohol dehydrogenase family)
MPSATLSPPPGDFTGHSVIVSGGSLGLGRAYVEFLAASGCNVTIVDVNADAGQQVLDSALSRPGSVIAEWGDVSDPKVAIRAVNAARKAFGGVTGVINNAGVSVPAAFSAQALPVARRLWEVHVGGSWSLTAAAWPYLTESGQGRVVFTGSGAALWGTDGVTPYAAAKGAVIGLARSLAVEARGTGILVNVLVPGAATGLATSVTDPARLLERQQSQPPEAVAPVAGYLVHRDCSLSRQIVVARGGRVAEVAFLESVGVVTEDSSPLTTGQAMTDAGDFANAYRPGDSSDDYRFHQRVMSEANAGNGPGRGAGEAAGSLGPATGCPACAHRNAG